MRDGGTSLAGAQRVALDGDERRQARRSEAMLNHAKPAAATALLIAALVFLGDHAANAAESVRGGTLNVGIDDDTKALDPVYSIAWS
jgi:hypothetical protein